MPQFVVQGVCIVPNISHTSRHTIRKWLNAWKLYQYIYNKYYVSNKRSLFTLRGFTITSKSIGFSGITGDVFSQVMFEFWSSRYLKHSLQMSAEQYEPISVGSTQRTHSQPKCLPIEQMMSAWDTFYIRNCTI